MIDKEKARASGCEVIDHADDTKKQEKLARLKALDPSLVNSDGIVDVNALKDFMGTENTSSNNKGFELTFAGKGLVRAMADAPTTKELRIEARQSKHFADTENVIIRGDNMDALKLLKKNYYGRIKMIYIDPPYNTGSDNFVYKDNFKQDEEQLIQKFGLKEDTINYLNNIYSTKTHSGWLAFMYPRLVLARDLLTDDGVMFISVDDNEQANLKITCDEIFGEENIETMIWHKVGSGDAGAGKMKVTRRFRGEHEYIIVCYKRLENVKFNKYSALPDFKGNYNNPDNDPRGNYKAGNISTMNGERSNPGRKNYYEVISPSGKTFARQWHFAKEEFDKLDKDNRIYWGKSGDSVPQVKIFLDESRPTTPISILEDKGSATSANKMNKKIFGDKIFSNPKPVELVEHLLKIVTTGNENNIILDFFAGSGTTAHAVMELNKEDQGGRRFILVQWDEKIDEEESRPACEFCKENNLEPVISSICIERVNRAGDELKQDMLNEDLDTGYKVFSLADRPALSTEAGQAMKLSIDRATAQDTLYNMFVLSGEVLLTDPVKEKEPGLLYKVGNSYYLLGNCKADLKSADRVFVDGYADIDLEKWLNTLGLDSDRVKVLY